MTDISSTLASIDAATGCNARMWSYDHWRCRRRRWHLGKHRFNNYVGARFPRFWRLAALNRVRDANRRLKGYRKPGESKPRLLDYRRVLYPDTYAPVPVRRSDPGRTR